MKSIVAITQLVLAVLLIVVVLLQQKGAGLGAAFGGTGTMHTTRRGVDKIIFNATIVIATGFLLVSVAAVLLK